MTKYWLNILLLIITCTAAALFAGCSDDDALREAFPQDEEEAEGCVYIRFRMNFGEPGIPGGTRSGEINDNQTPGTTGENAVNTVDLLIYEKTSGKLIDIVNFGKDQAAQMRSEEGICVPIYAEKGQTVHIYAAVNMTTGMRNQFVVGRGKDLSITSAVSGNDYWSVIDEFVPGSTGNQETLDNNRDCGIPMTGQFKIDNTETGNEDITITNGHPTKEQALNVTANVSRIIAKVHVLATPADALEPVYVKATYDPSESPADRTNPENWIGWIRLGNVLYIPNATNKSTYILPQPNDDPNSQPAWKDLNMNLERYIDRGSFNAQLWGNDYAFLDGNALQSEIISPNCRMAKAEALNQTKLDATMRGETERYTQGMYCLENYFNTPADATRFENSKEAIPMITHVSIAAKLTPRVILAENDYVMAMTHYVNDYKTISDADFRDKYNLGPNDFTDDDVTKWDELKTKYFTNPHVNHGYLEIAVTSEKDARSIINWSLQMKQRWARDASDLENGLYPDGTFYVYDQQFDGTGYTGQQYLYLTEGAIRSTTGENITIKARSVPHIGGWGYYYTYIDNDGSTVNGKTPYTASQVTRNTYYLITIGNFGMPGGSITSPMYIKVNTSSVGWDYAGRGDIHLY